MISSLEDLLQEREPARPTRNLISLPYLSKKNYSLKSFPSRLLLRNSKKSIASPEPTKKPTVSLHHKIRYTIDQTYRNVQLHQKRAKRKAPKAKNEGKQSWKITTKISRKIHDKLLAIFDMKKRWLDDGYERSKKFDFRADRVFVPEAMLWQR